MKKHTFLTGLLRWIVAGVFIFSGFVKAVDPWGTAIKFGEYFNAFGMGWLSGAEYAFSILLSASEMLLGLCLLFRIREKSVTTLLTILLGFFTLLTFVLALWNPVADCGCFGDFVKLTNWQTFFKNVILLLFTVVLWRTAWKQPFRQHNRYASTVEWSMIFFFGLLSSGIGLYSLRHVPPIDFLPFRIGVNIPSQLEGYGNDTQTTLIYKDRTTGQQREFDLADTTWYDTLRWEYVDTRIVENNRKRRSEIQDFSVFNADENYAPTLLASTREVFLIALNPIDRPLSSICSRQIEQTVRYAVKYNYPVVCVTASALPEDGKITFGDSRIPVYNMDGTTLKMLIRARAGLVLLKEGTILGKWNCRDIPNFERDYDGRTPLETVTERRDRNNRIWPLGLLAAALAFIYVAYTSRRVKE